MWWMKLQDLVSRHSLGLKRNFGKWQILLMANVHTLWSTVLCHTFTFIISGTALSISQCLWLTSQTWCRVFRDYGFATDNRLRNVWSLRTLLFWITTIRKNSLTESHLERLSVKYSSKTHPLSVYICFTTDPERNFFINSLSFFRMMFKKLFALLQCLSQY
jgi:hypothetical protein